jgi:hypothetical protein
MALLSDGRIVHSKRIDIGGDLHDQLDPKGLKVVNRFIKDEPLEKNRVIVTRKAISE